MFRARNSERENAEEFGIPVPTAAAFCRACEASCRGGWPEIRIATYKGAGARKRWIFPRALCRDMQVCYF
jgi:hypothetical protein